ncbi:MAG: hypothetical protein FJ194_09240 [Gammaproteobacteria bacterium]|nr:hypothetical protein [Gammaproteobacteria bacterium]
MAFQIGKWSRLGSAPAKTQGKKQLSPYRTVLIVPGAGGCYAKARELAQKPILINEAPVLPLPGCDAIKCNCRFNRRPDRREGLRRAADDGLTSAFVFENERRTHKRGRRKSDPA